MEYKSIYKNVFPFSIQKIGNSLHASMTFPDNYPTKLIKFSNRLVSIHVRIVNNKKAILESIINHASMHFDMLTKKEKELYRGAGLYLLCQTMGWSVQKKLLKSSAFIEINASGNVPTGNQKDLVHFYEKLGFIITDDSDEDNVDMKINILTFLKSCAKREHLMIEITKKKRKRKSRKS